MTWAEYYERYDGWQESTQYSRLASIKDFGPDESPSEDVYKRQELTGCKQRLHLAI